MLMVTEKRKMLIPVIILVLAGVVLTGYWLSRDKDGSLDNGESSQTENIPPGEVSLPEPSSGASTTVITDGIQLNISNNLEQISADEASGINGLQGALASYRNSETPGMTVAIFPGGLQPDVYLRPSANFYCKYVSGLWREFTAAGEDLGAKDNDCANPDSQTYGTAPGFTFDGTENEIFRVSNTFRLRDLNFVVTNDVDYKAGGDDAEEAIQSAAVSAAGFFAESIVRENTEGITTVEVEN